MDALTFGSSVLLRHLTFSEARFVSHKGFLCCFCYVGFTAERFYRLMLILTQSNAISMKMTKLVVAAYITFNSLTTRSDHNLSSHYNTNTFMSR